MKMNFFKITVALCLFALLFISSLGQSQQNLGDTSSIFEPDTGQRSIDMDIVNMEVESVLKIISDTSGWTIISSQKVRGKINLWSKGATARQLLDKLSLVNNYVYQQEGNVIYIMTKDEYEQLFGRTTKTFSLKHQKAESIKLLLENGLTKTGKLAIDPWSNTVVVNDTAENLKKIELLIARLDQGFVRKRFQLVNARAADVAKILDKIYPKEGPFQADVRTNSIVLFNSQSNVSRTAELIAQLDQDAVTRIFQIKFQRASELAKQLTGFMSSSGDAKTPNVTNQIIVSEATNQIIVTGNASKVEYIAGLLEELDSKVVTTTIPLKHLKVLQVLSGVSHLASKPENITVDSQGNRLIIRDNTRNIEQIRKVIQELDEDLVTNVFTLQYAMAEDIENALKAMVTDPDAFRSEPRTNQIIISGRASQVARIENIIKKLDCEDAYFTRTYYLEHASASAVAGIIESFISRQGPQKIYSSQAQRIQDDQTYEPAGQGPSEIPSVSPRKKLDTNITHRALGTRPGLAGTRISKTAEATPTSVVPPPSRPSPGTVVTSGAETAADSLGTAGTVVADDRSNTVTITETLATLTKVEQLIRDLDVPVNLYGYKVKCRQLDSLELESKLTSLLRPQEDSFSVDNQTRNIHFTTIPSVAERILEMLEDWDKPAKQALIRAKILAVNVSALKDIGVNFESFFDIDGTDIILEGSLPSQVGEDRFGSITVRKLTGTQYETIVRAIETDSRSQILANPRILVLDGQSAEFRMATDEPFTETSIAADSGQVIENVRFLQVGNILMVIPNIREDNTIEMDINLDVSSLIEIRNGVPVVNRNTATTTVTVKNNHVLMIGGLKFKREINVIEKIPVFGDIPLVGNLFRSERNELADTELVLFLQPTIVNASEGEYRPSQTDNWEHITDQINQDIPDSNVHSNIYDDWLSYSNGGNW
ncbi:MAG: secretin N-terminal domain-containing protein [Planctomycetota bacterium]|jgi:type II secretory pathway component GspD/PulD (secretin)